MPHRLMQHWKMLVNVMFYHHRLNYISSTLAKILELYDIIECGALIII